MAKNVNMLAKLTDAARVTSAEPQPANGDASDSSRVNDQEYARLLLRRADRVRAWANRQAQQHVIDEFSWAVVMLLEKRKTDRLRKQVDAIKDANRINLVESLDVYRRTAMSFARDLGRQEERRRKGGIARHAADPKQLAKAGALDLWKERQKGKQPKLRTVEQFATEVMRRWPILTSSKVICGWSAKWTRELREGRTPAC